MGAYQNARNKLMKYPEPSPERLAMYEALTPDEKQHLLGATSARLIGGFMSSGAAFENLLRNAALAIATESEGKLAPPDVDGPIPSPTPRRSTAVGLEGEGRVKRAVRSRQVSSPEAPRVPVGDVEAAPLYPLWAFQEEDVSKIVKMSKGALNANDMGLGKTIEAIEVVRRTGAAWVLCVVPNSKKYDWEEEIRKWDPTCFVTVIPNNGFDRRLTVSELLDTYHASRATGTAARRWYVMNWEQLRLIPELSGVVWDWVILDESHRMRNRKSAQTRAIIGGEDRKKNRFAGLVARRKMPMTGTPMDGRPYELWPMLNFIDPLRFGSYWNFFKEYCDFVPGEYGGLKFVGVKNLEQLKEILAGYMIRHLKEEVLPDLPPKTFTDVWVDMTIPQMREYLRMEEEMIAWIENAAGGMEELTAPAVIAQIVRMKQIATSLGIFQPEKDESGKLDALMEILEDAPVDRKIIIFSQFSTVCHLIERRIWKRNDAENQKEDGKPPIRAVIFTGEEKPVENETAKELFLNDPSVQIFIATTQKGGEGLNLTVADTIIFTDETWSPLMQRQASDRIHRIGQTRPCQIITLLSRQSIDSRIRQALNLKTSVAADVLGLTSYERLSTRSLVDILVER